mmetsp:Transcript_18344/g.26653  ORF Transcript_18344/g.26653 Transcript_18344/m.26653 type:complete len:85 (+) Transcript_18344:396-650(+)
MPVLTGIDWWMVKHEVKFAVELSCFNLMVYHLSHQPSYPEMDKSRSVANRKGMDHGFLSIELSIVNLILQVSQCLPTQSYPQIC